MKGDQVNLVDVLIPRLSKIIKKSKFTLLPDLEALGLESQKNPSRALLPQ